MMDVVAALCFLGLFLFFLLGAAAVCQNLRRLRGDIIDGRCARDALDRKLLDVRKQLQALEERLDVLGAPQTAADLVVMRRLLNDILDHLIDQHDREDWWRRGKDPPSL